MNIIPMPSLTLKKVRQTIVLIYIIGAIGICVPFTRPLFVFLTPFALLFSTLLLGYEKYFIDNSHFSKAFLWYAIFVYFLSLLIEIIGVNTGWPFGTYTYHEALGLKIMGTPLLIGINWLVMVYGSAILFNRLKSKIVRIITASLLMLVFDVTMEQVACNVGLWCFQFNKVPLDNYISWFVLAIIFHSIAEIFNIKFSSRVAGLLFLAQMGYFLAIFIVFKLIPGLL
jgi:bisanhydrobacterioruberin hydratase